MKKGVTDRRADRQTGGRKEVFLQLFGRSWKRDPWGPLYEHVLTIIPWINKCMYHLADMFYSFPNFNGCTVEVGKWMDNFIPIIVGFVITIIVLIHVNKNDPGWYTLLTHP